MAARAITRTYDDALRATGLRATQLSVLAAVGARLALAASRSAPMLRPGDKGGPVPPRHKESDR